MRVAAMARSTLRSGGLYLWVGRLWQSTQSMRRTAIVSFAPRSPPLAVYSVTLPLGSVSRTQEIAWRLASLRYSILLAIFMCQWIPAVAWPLSGSPPPVLMSRRTWRGVLASSELKWLNTFSWAPQKFLGQWHCSQVCAAGRRLATGDSMGRATARRGSMG